MMESVQPRFGKWCRQLSDERFPVRERAEQALHELLHETPADQPNPVEAACYEAWLQTSDPEVRLRLREVLTDFAVNLWGPKPYLGVSAVTEKVFNEEGRMVSQLRIQTVAPDSGAAEAGVRAGDCIVGIGDLRLDGEPDAKAKLASMLQSRNPGDRVTLRLSRKGDVRSVPVRLGHSPWVKTKPDADEPVPPLDPEHCLEVYLEKKRSAR